MVYLSSVSSKSAGAFKNASFGKNPAADSEKQEQDKPAVLLYNEMKEHPVKMNMKIAGNRLLNAFTVYPKKGLEGSKNSNFYEFLAMGTVPYLIGSGMMIAVFNAAAKYFDTPAAQSALKAGRKMAAGVILYGIAKTLSKKLIEYPLKAKYGIDINVPYKKKIDELPEERNRNKLISYEYHKAYESVDFPYWELFYGNEAFGKERDSYFKHIGGKMGYSKDELKYSDQKVKPRIREKLVQAKAFSSLSSYLWAASAVCIAAQKPFESLDIHPIKGIFNLIKNPKTGLKNFGSASFDFCRAFYKSFKEFIGTDKAGITDYIVNKCKHLPLKHLKRPSKSHIAGRLLLLSAIGMTLAGNFLTLSDFNKDRGRKSNAAQPLIDSSKKKVVC